MQTDVFLVRHGQSHSNVEGCFRAVPPGPGLTARGRLQAEAARDRLLELGVLPAAIVSSPLLRAIETAAPLCAALGLAAAVEPALAETSFGDWEGRRFEELRPLPRYHAWLADPESSPPPGGERLSELGARAGGVLRRLADRYDGGAVVAFSHMHPVIAAVLDLLGRPMAEHRQIRVPNATIVHLRRGGGVFRMVEIDARAAGAGEIGGEGGGLRAGA